MTSEKSTVRWFVLACLLSLVAAGCAPIVVDTRTEPGANLASYQRFITLPSTVQSTNPADDTLRIAEGIQAAIEEVLLQKGLRAGSASDADLAVAFTVETEESARRVNAADPDTDFYVEQNFSANTLRITLSDAVSGKALWQGQGEVEFRKAGSLLSEGRESALVRAARKIVSELPTSD